MKSKRTGRVTGPRWKFEANASVIALTLLMIVACASSSGLNDAQVSHMSRDEIKADDARLPSAGYLSTGQPDPEVLDKAAAAGYVAVIDFRGADEDRGIEERTEVEARGMRYIALPVPGPADATWDRASALSDALSSIDGPVLLHCFSGNRAGSMLAMAAKLEGASDEDALALGKRAGLTRWESEITEIVEESGL